MRRAAPTYSYSDSADTLPQAAVKPQHSGYDRHHVLRLAYHVLADLYLELNTI